MRVKYHPDGQIYIGNSYIASFEDFKKDCLVAKIDNPFTEGEFIEIKASGEVEAINEEGHHIALEDFDTKVFNPIVQKFDILKQEREDRVKPVQVQKTKEQLIQDEFDAKYTLNQKIELLMNAIINNSSDASIGVVGMGGNSPLSDEIKALKKMKSDLEDIKNKHK